MLKRQNFNVDPDQEAALETARVFLNAPTIKDAVLRSANIVNSIGRELRLGKQLMVVDQAGKTSRILIPEMETSESTWTYLCSRPHPWRKQFWIKGRRQLASTVWLDMIANKMTPEEVAEDLDLPIEVVQEAIAYSEQNQALIEMEAREEKSRLVNAGIKLNA